MSGKANMDERFPYWWITHSGPISYPPRSLELTVPAGSKYKLLIVKVETQNVLISHIKNTASVIKIRYETIRRGTVVASELKLFGSHWWYFRIFIIIRL